MAELCQLVDVSEATIRRDLDSLSRSGQLRRLRGGAGDLPGRIQPERDVRSFREVAESASAAKRAIGARASSLVEDGEVIGLDSGTTVAAMTPYLADKALTVVTSSLAVVEGLEEAPEVDIMLIGGLLRPNYRSLVGTWTEEMLGQIRLDKVFLGTSGLMADGSVMDSTPSEVPVKRAFLRAARQRFLLADAEKFPGSGFLRVCGLDEFTAVVTDGAPGAIDVPDDIDVEVLHA